MTQAAEFGIGSSRDNVSLPQSSEECSWWWSRTDRTMKPFHEFYDRNYLEEPTCGELRSVFRRRGRCWTTGLKLMIAGQTSLPFSGVGVVLLGWRWRPREGPARMPLGFFSLSLRALDAPAGVVR
jgi:hypothetical protein